MTLDPDAMLARISEAMADIVRIYTFDKGSSWTAWCCNDCRKLWLAAKYGEKGVKEPPHDLRCDGGPRPGQECARGMVGTKSARVAA
jgi:hypothetical protein